MGQPNFPIVAPNVSPTGVGPQVEGTEQATEGVRSTYGTIAMTHNGGQWPYGNRPGSVGGKPETEMFRFEE